jgi:sortase A
VAPGATAAGPYDRCVSDPQEVPPDRRRRPRRARKRVSIVGILGELLVTAGVLVLLFLGWQLWFNDIVVGAQQQTAADQLAEEWRQRFEQSADRPNVEPTPGADEEEPAPPVEPVVAAVPGRGVPFATLMVPRFGEDYARVIGEGVGNSVLNSTNLGIGHYTGTQMPGEVGNFAVAAHRKAYGGAFEHLNSLRVGDPIFIETADGWYEYTYRSTEYVPPTGIDVLAPVPQDTEAQPGDRILTLTTCNPLFSTAERLIAYATFEAWYPRASGAPAEIAGTVQADGE